MRQWPYVIIDLHRVPPIDPSAAKLASTEVLTIVLRWAPLLGSDIFFARVISHPIRIWCADFQQQREARQTPGLLSALLLLAI